MAQILCSKNILLNLSWVLKSHLSLHYISDLIFEGKIHNWLSIYISISNLNWCIHLINKIQKSTGDSLHGYHNVSRLFLMPEKQGITQLTTAADERSQTARLITSTEVNQTHQTLMKTPRARSASSSVGLVTSEPCTTVKHKIKHVWSSQLMSWGVHSHTCWFESALLHTLADSGADLPQQLPTTKDDWDGFSTNGNLTQHIYTLRSWDLNIFVTILHHLWTFQLRFATSKLTKGHIQYGCKS